MIYRAPFCDRLSAWTLDIAKVTFYKTDAFSNCVLNELSFDGRLIWTRFVPRSPSSGTKTSILPNFVFLMVSCFDYAADCSRWSRSQCRLSIDKNFWKTKIRYVRRCRSMQRLYKDTVKTLSYKSNVWESWGLEYWFRSGVWNRLEAV